MTLRELIDATLCGKDERLVARCDVPAILEALETFGVYSVNDLRSTLDVSLNALQLALGSAAPPSFLSLVKVELSAPDSRESPLLAVPIGARVCL